jgi:hypothetical protein
MITVPHLQPIVLNIRNKGKQREKTNDARRATRRTRERAKTNKQIGIDRGAYGWRFKRNSIIVHRLRSHYVSYGANRMTDEELLKKLQEHKANVEGAIIGVLGASLIIAVIGLITVIAHGISERYQLEQQKTHTQQIMRSNQ